MLVTQVGYTAINVVDTMMSDRAGTDDLAGVAISSSLWMPIMVAVGGLLSVTQIIG
ncbi:MATE family efflux transporter [Bacillus sp. JCM 19041]|uniref:MATE family efflux transporter n=1 Tax=Bacillus sp. JCM 19041 TaxID=1460637 RepID=UPI0012E161E1